MSKLTLRAVELSEKRWSDHSQTLQRSLVLLARLPQYEPDEAPVVFEVRRRLRELLETVEGTK